MFDSSTRAWIRQLVMLAAAFCAHQFAYAAASSDSSATEVTLQTQTGNLYGSLLLPQRQKDASAQSSAVLKLTTSTKPMVVVIHAGSGPTDRDGNAPTAKNDSLKLLAEGLAREGIASLRVDKRGVAASRAAVPSEKDLRFSTYVDDLGAWINLLKKDDRFAGVVVAGHSEGSLIGMMAAQKAQPIAYISVSGIARSAGDVLRTQLKPKLPESLWKESERVLGMLEAGKLVDDPPPELVSLYRPSVQPYMVSWLPLRPTLEIVKLKMPILIVQGTTDIQVAVSEANALKAAAPAATLTVIDGMNHVLKNVVADPSKQTASYSDPTLPLHPALVPAIVEFVRKLGRKE